LYKSTEDFYGLQHILSLVNVKKIVMVVVNSYDITKKTKDAFQSSSIAI